MRRACGRASCFWASLNGGVRPLVQRLPRFLPRVANGRECSCGRFPTRSSRTTSVTSSSAPGTCSFCGYKKLEETLLALVCEHLHSQEAVCPAILTSFLASPCCDTGRFPRKTLFLNLGVLYHQRISVRHSGDTRFASWPKATTRRNKDKKKPKAAAPKKDTAATPKKPARQ